MDKPYGSAAIAKRHLRTLTRIGGIILCGICLSAIFLSSQILAEEPAGNPTATTVDHVQVKPIILIPSDAKDVPYWHGVVLTKHLKWRKPDTESCFKGKIHSLWLKASRWN